MSGDGNDARNAIEFEYVDPLVKVLAEASYFKPAEALSEVVRGENATLQFIVRPRNQITGLQVDVSPAVNGENYLPPAKTGFVGYVKVGRSIWDYSRDRIVSASGYYPDPILEVESIDVDFGNTQAIWVSIPIPADAVPGTYEGKVTISGKSGKRNFSLSKDFSVRVYPSPLAKQASGSQTGSQSTHPNLNFSMEARILIRFPKNICGLLECLQPKWPNTGRMLH